MSKSSNKYFLKSSIVIISNLVITLIISLMINLNTYKLIYIYSILLMLYSFWIYRKDNLILIFNIFLTSYYIPIFQGYFLNLKLTPHSINFIGDTDEKVSLIYSIFLITYCIVIIIFFREKEVDLHKNLKIYNNKIIKNIITVGIIVCIFLGHKGLPTGGYTMSATIFNEYTIILFLILYIYGGGDNSRLRSCILFSIFSIVNFMYGDRIAVLQCGLMIFYLFFNKLFNYKTIIIAIVIVNQLFGLVSVYREKGSFVNDISSTYIADNVNTNQSQVFNSSIVIFKLVDDKIINSRDRLKSGIEFLARVFVSQNKLSELSNLSLYSMKFNPAQGGGFIASYFYIWMSYIGVVFIAIIVGYIILITRRKNNNIITIMLLVIMSFYPRWIAYEPMQLIKASIYCIMVYLLLKPFKILRIVF